ncbi:uncharacterized protein ACOB8E_007156 isoform 1-T1 [Sarcophilus harrisii]
MTGSLHLQNFRRQKRQKLQSHLLPGCLLRLLDKIKNNSLLQARKYFNSCVVDSKEGDEEVSQRKVNQATPPRKQYMALENDSWSDVKSGQHSILSTHQSNQLVYLCLYRYHSVNNPSLRRYLQI